MDTSKQYVEMCDCPEIQEQRTFDSTLGEYSSWDEGDIFSKDDGDLMDIFHICDGVWFPPREDALWLPRQDQLQEMYPANRVVTLEGFNQFCGTINVGIWFIKSEYFDYSPEQLWLAFVMEEKHNKVWDGKWVDRV